MSRARPRSLRPPRAVVYWLSAVALAVALRIWLHLQMTDAGYELSLLRHTAVRLGQERSELEAELATMTSPRALDAVARGRLGLRPPGDGQVVALP